MFTLLFFVNFTNTLHYNFVKFFSYKKIVNGLGALSIVAPFYDIPIQKIKELLLIKTIKNINIKKADLYKAVDAYNPKIRSAEQNDSMKNAYLNLDKQVSNTLHKLQNDTQNDLRQYYKNVKATERELNITYTKTIACLNNSTLNPSVEEHNNCLNLWEKDKHFTKDTE